MKQTKTPRPARATAAEKQAARAQYATDFVEIDEDARVSRTKGGTWVQAWVFLPRG